MGDPKRIRKKYTTPSHPWIKSRIDEEKSLTKEFGTKNKKEIWKAVTLLKNFKNQAKNLISLHGNQAEIETAHLFRKVKELGLVQGDVTFDIILGLDTAHVLSRRLQSVLFKKGLAKTVGQARQFIVHGHIFVDKKKITAPSYLVGVKEESLIEFAVNSSLYDADHPERMSAEKKADLETSKSLAAKKVAESDVKSAKLKAKADKADEVKETKDVKNSEADIKSTKVDEVKVEGDSQ